MSSLNLGTKNISIKESMATIFACYFIQCSFPCFTHIMDQFFCRHMIFYEIYTSHFQQCIITFIEINVLVLKTISDTVNKSNKN